MTISASSNSTSPSYTTFSSLHCDVLIIGAGLAGLTTALSLPTNLKVTVLSKKELNACSSHYAQGGIAASLAPEDSVAQHLQDTLIAGDGLCDNANSQTILNDGAAAVTWLQAQGVPFTLDESTDPHEHDPSMQPLHLTQEGGHGRRRIAHADDATGQYIMQTLQQRLLEASHISVLTGVEALELTSNSIASLSQNSDDASSVSNRCIGAVAWDSNQQQLLNIDSKAVVLASGGLGQLFQRATAPDVCMGDGMMMAWQAGCRLANLEFVQFHPTGLVAADSNFLISEAVRGEGGYLRCPLTGKRFMQHYDVRLELAPRDIVARAIADQISHNGLGYVHLDISHQPADFIRQHFPKIDATLTNLGIDMTHEPIAVAPTAHYTCGGVVSSADGLTDVRGLYAVGEVAYTGLHGANRLASNSLLECVVVGRRIAQHLPQYLTAVTDQRAYPWPVAKVDNGYVMSFAPDAVAPPALAHLTKSLAAISSTKHTVSNALDSQLPQLDEFKKLMSTHLGIIRDQGQLQAAYQQLQQWQAEAQYEQHLASNEKALLSPLDQLNLWRWQRLLTLAMCMLQSALGREESRGGHFRSDRPKKSELAQVSLLLPPLASQSNDPQAATESIPLPINASKQSQALQPPKPLSANAVA